MPCLFLLLWLGATVVLWVFVFRGCAAPRGEAGQGRGILATLILWFALPPTLIWLVSMFVLLQAAPTVQFNAGNSYAMDLWSFWVAAWPILYFASGGLALCYAGWSVAVLATRQAAWVRGVVVSACLSAGFGWLVLRLAFPSA